MMPIRQLTANTAAGAVAQLAGILEDCVAAGASVSFMAGLTHEAAIAFWQSVADGVAANERILLTAEDQSGRLVGTVQVILATPPNQPHRGEIAKMLVAPSARRQGVGASLMRAAEEAARQAGKSLLTLDTVSGAEGYRLYLRLGWQIAGEIPGYALWPDGRPCPTTFMWRRIA